MTLRIIEPTPVTIDLGDPLDDVVVMGSNAVWYHPLPTTPHFLSDNVGRIQLVHIPDALNDMFQWLSERGSLDKLVNAQPDIKDETQHWLSLNSVNSDIAIDAKSGNPHAIKALAAANLKRTATWLFTDKAEAIVFKLTWGGQ